ncbi:hypothetical protein H6761_00710 [Candidatus Nomurabacteria bacterium]|nr:hypothetical protein [Candidatus Nomurabacteria bacterium]
MSLEKQFAKLKNLEKFQANQDWQMTSKYDLMSEIHSQARLMKAQQLSSAEKFDLFVMRFTRRLMPSVSKMVAGLLIVVMGSGVSFAAQASVPGQALWPVKRSIEKAELTLAFSSVTETEVHIKHLNKRLEEINKIVEKSKVTDEPTRLAKNEKAIKQVVQHLEKEAVAVDQNLKIVKEDTKPIEVVNLAKKVTEVAKEAKKQVGVLEGQVAQTDRSVVLKEALDNVKVINEEVNRTAVDVAIQVHEEIVAAKVEKVAKEILENHFDQAQTVIDDQEIEDVTKAVVELIFEDINELNDEIQATKEKTEIISAENIGEAVTKANSVVADQELPVDGGPAKVEVKDIKEIKEQSGEAQATLEQAKTLLEEGSLKDAVAKVVETKKIQEKTATVIKNIEQAVQEKAVSDKAEASATSTVQQIKPINIQISSTTIEKAMINDEDALVGEEEKIKEEAITDILKQ